MPKQISYTVPFVFHVNRQKELQVVIPEGKYPYMRVMRRGKKDGKRDYWMNVSKKGMKRLDVLMPLIKEDLQMKKVNICYKLTSLIGIGVVEFQELLYVGLQYQHGIYKNFINFTPKDFSFMEENWAKIMAWFPLNADKVSMVKNGLTVAEESRPATGFGVAAAAPADKTDDRAKVDAEVSTFGNTKRESSAPSTDNQQPL